MKRNMDPAWNRAQRFEALVWGMFLVIAVGLLAWELWGCGGVSPAKHQENVLRGAEHLQSLEACAQSALAFDAGAADRKAAYEACAARENQKAGMK